jgi:hypothetical protein
MSNVCVVTNDNSEMYITPCMMERMLECNVSEWFWLDKGYMLSQLCPAFVYSSDYSFDHWLSLRFVQIQNQDKNNSEIVVIVVTTRYDALTLLDEIALTKACCCPQQYQVKIVWLVEDLSDIPSNLLLTLENFYFLPAPTATTVRETALTTTALQNKVKTFYQLGLAFEGYMFRWSSFSWNDETLNYYLYDDDEWTPLLKSYEKETKHEPTQMDRMGVKVLEKRFRQILKDHVEENMLKLKLCFRF